jgi:hypothetical protein
MGVAKKEGSLQLKLSIRENQTIIEAKIHWHTQSTFSKNITNEKVKLDFARTTPFHFFNGAYPYFLHFIFFY